MPWRIVRHESQVILRITKRDGHADDRVGALQPDRDEHGAQHDAERDEAVDPRVVAVGDECRAVQTTAGAQPHLRRQLVAREADRAGGCDPAEVRELLRVDQAARSSA